MAIFCIVDYLMKRKHKFDLTILYKTGAFLLISLHQIYFTFATALCSFPGCPAHGSIVFSNEILEDGTIASYYCERGFELLGPVRKICENGNWSPSGIPFCVINVATGKAPMQISTEEQGVSQKAIDSSTSMFFDKNTCTLTKAEKHPWWYVNLLEPYMVQLIRLDFGKSCCGKNPAIVVVRVGNSRPDMGVNPICNKFIGFIEEGQPLFLPCNPPTPGAFVSVHLENDEPNHLSICEAFVYTDQALPIERCPIFRDQPPGATASYNGKCYMFYNKQLLGFNSAQSLCESRNGTLINEINPALQGFISWELWRRHHVSSSSHFWLGAVRNKTTKIWKWINGGHVLVSFWNNIDSYGDCAIFDGSKGWLWSVAECDMKLNFICQHQPSTCGNPEQPPNSTIVANKGFEVGSKVFYFCDPGHLLVGSPVRECLETGFYGEFPPVCKYIDCDRPASIPFGSFILINETTTYESIVKYSCNQGYEIKGKNILKCDMDGRWNGPPPSCQITECEALSTGNRNIIIDITNGTLYQSKAKIKCKDGYILDGVNILTCKEDGQWDHSLPGCRQISIKSSTTKENVFVKTTARDDHKDKKVFNKLSKNQDSRRNTSKISNLNNNIETKSKLLIENNGVSAINDHQRNQISHVETTVNTRGHNVKQSKSSFKLNFASLVSVGVFAGFILLSTTITSLVLLFKRMHLSRRHYKQKRSADCKTIASIDSSLSSSTNGLNRYYRQAWENLHEFANKSNLNYNYGIKTKKEYPESRNKRHHHHHHHHRNDQCNFVAPSKRH
ncbi:uncharacterized protein LOC129616487 isoform X2 [Condylostylus longicornis]|uniref:uncharacterized protein LOC129616487 isoform X2 n=1 Tax=Condylostylus longicornis TaxID=2530218 RepID=UPI00244DC175|nr:uncharacterized protein LOC129616487 isoform X2 [Condylostylus longicornis]